ncbi:type II secretion system protein GspJ [Victivallis sp. Marseille-Q1083]|uniref:type II secretion system protein GspJ n=1 Tax=Victivallis sp. Marseille-Q1083 TaxID=2717288 RepID=UPI00158BD911|nr:type II secretion system protein GspJ [Victivallis sp. Marseille-Q1083]
MMKISLIRDRLSRKCMIKRQFTLLEVVLAVMIFAVIGTLTSVVLFGVQQSYERITAGGRQLEARMRLDRIADVVLANAVPFVWPDGNGKDRSIFYGQPDRVILGYRHRVNGGEESGLRFIELFCRSGQLVARYRQQPILYWESEPGREEATEEVLLEAVKEVRFEYADRRREKIDWRGRWDENDAPRFPAAISMKIIESDGTELQYLRRTAGSSRYSTYGKQDETL